MTALASLRISAGLDMTDYVRGAQAKVAADNAMIESDRRKNAALAQADAAHAKAIPGMRAIGKALLEGYGPASQFEAMIRKIGGAVDRGMGFDRAQVVLEAAYNKFGLVADATKLAQQGFVAIAPTVDALTKRYNDMAAAAQRAAEVQQEAARRAQQAATEAQNAAAAQSSINAQFGIGKSSAGSAEASASAFLAEYGGLEGIAKAKAAQIANSFGRELETRMVPKITSSAKASAAAFESTLDSLDEQIATAGSVNIQAGIDRMMEVARLKLQQAGTNFRQLIEEGFDFDRVAKSARESASVLEREFDRIDKSISTAGGDRLNDQMRKSLAEQRKLLDDIGQIGGDRFNAQIAQMMKEQDLAAAAAVRLRGAINPMEAEMGRIGKEIAYYNSLLKQGKISSDEFARYQQVAGKRLSDFEKSLKNGATAGRVMSGELVNLSYQLNDVFTGLALGQSPFMILAQQGGQIFQIFQTSKASVGELAREIGGRLLNALTASRLAFIGIGAAIGTAVFALNDYLPAQSKITMALTGAGRASGATVGGINRIAEAGSSTFGLSVSEAREMAAALAATGRVANDNILPIVKMGKDIAHAFGVDATEASKMLAEAFSNPSRGAESLNQRLGFLDASMKRNIDNLVAQNRVYEAQRVLLDSVTASLAGVDAAVAKSVKGWTAVGNVISNAWDWLGKFIARGLNLETLDTTEQLKQVEARIAALQDRMQARTRTGAAGWMGGRERKDDAADAAELERLTRERDKHTQALQRQADATARAQATQRSFAQEAAMRQALPDVAQLEGFKNQVVVLEGAISDTKDAIANIFPDEAAGARLKALTEALNAYVKALEKATAEVKDFKTENDKASITARIAYEAVTAYSPAARAEIARKQAELQYGGNSEREKREQDAYRLSIHQTTEAITEQHREQLLGSQQAAESARADITLVGRSIAPLEGVSESEAA